MYSVSMTRRSFTAAAGSAFAATALVGASSALADAPAQEAPAAQTSTPRPDGTEAQTASWLGAEPEVAEADIVETLECDVLVVGGGTAGMFAACSAAEEGAKTILIEKNGALPGIRGTLGAVNTKYQADLGVQVDPVAAVREIVHYGASDVDPNIVRLWASKSAEAIEWYGNLNEKAGREFWIASDLDLEEEAEHCYKHWCVGHAAVADGATTEDSTVLVDYAIEQGVETMYYTAMVKLEKADDRVTGVIATNENDEYIRINAAKGVIVCTGGYALNQEMLYALQPETLMMCSMNTGLPGTTGDGIKACLWAGADFDCSHTSMLFDRCPLPPDGISGVTAGCGMFWMGSQPWLKVNLAGKRFCNESSPYDFVLHASLHQPQHTYATIWDANAGQYIHQFKMQGCSRMYPFENGAPVSAMTWEMVQGMVQGLIEQGAVVQADTLEELAEKLGLPVETFMQTVTRYNELVVNGNDEDFGKEAFRLSPVDTAPFYGVRQSGQLLCTMDGIKIDEDVHALDLDGNPIAGLFVAGNDSGSFFAHTYPDLFPGLAAGRTATFARLAGKNAAAGK